MGREIKRVALDFDYPINKMIWIGYHNPYRGLECKSCEGSGCSPEYKKLSDDWYTHLSTDGQQGWGKNITQDEVEALVKGGRLWDLIKERSHYDKDTGKWMKWENGETIETVEPKMPTAEEVNDWASNGMGHDSINQWTCVRVRAERLGITETNCKHCQGDGVLWPDEKYAKLSEEFEGIEPPEGNGYQLWSTTTEGTPMSPVMSTPEELAKWLSDNGASSFGRSTATYSEWLKFIQGPGWAPSMMGSNKGLEDGVKAIVG